MIVDLHAKLADYSKIEIAKALARHSVEIGLQKHYSLNHLIPEGNMRVVEVKVKKISSKKALLIVKFISLPSLKNAQTLLFCTSLQTKTKQGQGADWRIMTALKITKPGAKFTFWPWRSLQATLWNYTYYDCGLWQHDGQHNFWRIASVIWWFRKIRVNPFRWWMPLAIILRSGRLLQRRTQPQTPRSDSQSAMKAEWIKSQTSKSDIAAYFRKFSVHRSTRKIVSSQAVSITRLSVKMGDLISVKYA